MATQQPSPSSSVSRHLLRARDAADRDYADPDLDVPALAARAHASVAHFSRQFKEVFGETPGQYLQTRRIERAQELLRLSDLSVHDVCLAVGFTSVGSFSTCFKRTVGESPAAFRDRVRGEQLLARIPSCFRREWSRPRAVPRPTQTVSRNRDDSAPPTA
jgi:AraC-like DNA-binding protein